ncbi:E3 ubiquitin/ISG15 ligase TRIM25-like isoform X2 [Brienomyrus brachyistius]|uniref:E3 ubiquitin/ISG15 ligase TRIM25-like isoform X2 n=1 Tax=Brienomyrus brachyistius TaxID=42636 RepID=UPI0020B2F808|nr:E3 ubiquitin/ISG15 ligase TRIM25-like isoform X2 [Brienomyrus brachyistius]
MAKSLASPQLKTMLEMGLTCSVCHDIFTDPHLLPCGHTFCKTCLLDMLEYNLVVGFRCPECRADFESMPLQKNFAVASIAEDFRKTQQRKNKLVSCDCCIPGNQATAVKTCLTCIVSMCEEHINPHLELPAFREHHLTEPLRDLRKMKCPQHEVYKLYCSASKTYVCRWCDIESKSTNATMKLKTINKDMMAEDQQYFVWRALGLLLVGIILACLASSIISSPPQPCIGQAEFEEVSSSLKKHDRLLAQIYYRLNRNALDPNSASPFLRISDDFMSVERENDRLPVDPHPHRFDRSPQVLTAQCVSTGVHYWEVEAEGYWDIAVSYSSIERKDKTHCTFGMNSKSWSLTQNKKKQLCAFHSGVKVDLHNKVLSQNRVIIAVDYEEGVIVFWDAKKLHKPLYTFTSRFTEPICLGFGLYQMDPPTRISIRNTS